MTKSTIPTSAKREPTAKPTSQPSDTLPKRTPATKTKFLSVSEAAEELKVSTKTIRRQIASKELLAIRVGRRVLIPTTGFALFIAKLPAA